MNTDIFQAIKEFWGALVAFVTTVGSLYAWKVNKDKNDKSATNLAFDELEAQKAKIIEQFKKEIAQHSELAEKEKLLNQLKINCPECYKAALEIIEKDGK